MLYSQVSLLVNAEFSPKQIVMSGLLKDDCRGTEIARMRSPRAVNVSRSVIAGKLFDFPLFLFVNVVDSLGLPYDHERDISNVK